MSNRNLRPNIHFTPSSNWMNDPNGMFYENGNFHLFYQHNPNGINCETMHWGHAVSRNLIDWEHFPVAIYPDNLGVIFSGSCYYDKDNISGFGTKEHPPVIAMYTSHGEVEQQSIAYSTNMMHFEKYYANPVLPNSELPDFRDPKMFTNNINKTVSVVVAAGDRAMFYETTDFKNWKKTGEFGPLNNVKGVWECPDMVQLECEGEEKWVFILSTTVTEDNDGARTYYFVGDFDGEKFISADKCEPKFVDCAPDNYAGVTFQNFKKPIFLAWGMNWAYGRETLTGGEYRGQMILAREMQLCKINGEYILKWIVQGVDKFKASAYTIPAEKFLGLDTFGVIVKGEGNCKLKLKNEIGNYLTFEITETELIVDRRQSGLVDFSKNFLDEKYCVSKAKRPTGKEYNLEMIFDVSIAEIFVYDGLVAFSATVYPQKPYSWLTIEGDCEAKFYEISR